MIEKHWSYGLLDQSASFDPTARAASAVDLPPPESLDLLDRTGGRLVIADDHLRALDRGLRGDHSVRVRVINHAAAGGLLALARRRFDHLRPVAVRSQVIDRTDLENTVRRLAIAARELDPAIEVTVELPADPTWPRVIETAELEGLSVAIADAEPEHLVPMASALIEADVPMIIFGVVRSPRRVITIVQRLIDGMDPQELIKLQRTSPWIERLAADDGDVPDPSTGRRLRRSLHAIEVSDVTKARAELQLSDPHQV